MPDLAIALDRPPIPHLAAIVHSGDALDEQSPGLSLGSGDRGRITETVMEGGCRLIGNMNRPFPLSRSASWSGRIRERVATQDRHLQPRPSGRAMIGRVHVAALMRRFTHRAWWSGLRSLDR